VVERLVLWDVDGTLVHTGIGAAIFDDALEAVVGARPPRRIRMSGKTDPLIVSEYLALMGVEETPARLAAVLDALAAGLTRAARDGALDPDAVCPGVPEVLAALAGRPGLVQSLLTGNVYANAVTKVTAYGLDAWLDLDVGAYGSDSIDRDALVPVALGRLAARRGARLAADRVWVVGDTPRDLACARAAGARCLLVATGGYPLADLAGLGADAVVANLADSGAVVALLTG
jgi:phosphoglycolate phosphatase